MIVPRGPDIRRLVSYVGAPLLLLFLYDVAIVLAYKVAHWEWIALPHIPVALLGSAIGIILSFRNNSSYGRWWEARTIWGSIINNTRSFGRQIVTNIRWQRPGDEAEVVQAQKELIYHQIAWTQALRQHLRGLPPLDELHGLLPEETLVELAKQKNIPFAIQVRQGHLLRECLEHDWIDSLQWQALDSTLNDFADGQGASERIKNTPMPKQYTFYPQLFVQIYALLLPLALVQNMGWFTPLGSTLVGFIFLALDKIGRDLESPFDNTIYDVPLTNMSRGIEINLRQALGEKHLPEPTQPIAGVLW